MSGFEFITERAKPDNIKIEDLVCKNCHKQEKSVVVFVLSKIGLEKPEIDYLKVINKLFELKCSIGMIGGKTTSAL